MAAGVSLAITAAWADDWPNFRGPNHDGTSSERITATWPLEVLWTKKVGFGYSETVETGGRVYTWGWVAGNDVVYCLDPATGAEIWTSSHAANVVPNHYGPRATLTVDSGKIYAMGSEADLYCYDAASGAELWHKDVSQELGFQCYQTERGESSSPIIEGDLILFCFGTGGAALDKNTGAKVWCHGSSGASFA
jgi:outer membrane protein assembly factor BamB